MFNDNEQQTSFGGTPVQPEATQPAETGMPAFAASEDTIARPDPQQDPVGQPVQQEDFFPQEEPAPVAEPAPQHRNAQYIPEPDAPKRKKRKPLGAGAIIAVALVCSLIGGILGAVGGVLATREKASVPSGSGNTTDVLVGERENTVIDIHKIDTSKIMTPAEVYASNVTSTVGITTSITTNFWGYQTTSAASGSGFIISADGYIITNHHVIEDSNSITVSFYDGTTKEAKLVGYDASNDLAVLKVEAENLRPVILGDSDNLNVGDTVLAIGNPLGELTFSLTVGTLSALDREVTTSAGVTMNLMQTDCAINSGNSGGALFNLYGEVIGITNAKYSSSSSSEASIDNIGFAIPLNNVKKIVESLIEKGYISKPYIGVSVADVSEETQSYGLPQGAAVRSVVEESPAAKAGLQANDIITAVDGNAITGSNDLVKTIGECEVGQVLKLTVYRKGVTIEMELTVGEQIQQGLQEETQQQQQPAQDGFSGFPFWGFGY